jgi:hypothetical protein
MIRLFILCLVALIPITAVADGNPATDGVPRLLPYQGLLELDGRPVNAVGDNALHIGFLLFRGADAEAHVYRQDLRIQVYNGRFTATIGPTGTDPAGAEVPIERIIANADDLYLGMILLGDPADPDDDIALSNRQRIHASPYAMWTTAATDLSVARNLVVGGSAVVDGDLTVRGAVNLPAGAINTAALADGAVQVGKVALGPGLRPRGDQTQLGVDDAYLDARIRSWVRSHCTIRLGWRDGCDNCNSAPAKEVTVQANNRCIAARGSDTRCRSAGDWGGINTDGGVNDDDVFYIRFQCD